MIAAVFRWILVGAAHRITAASPELADQGGVTPDEAFQLLATERGRHARHFAQEIARTWQSTSDTDELPQRKEWS